MVKPLRTAPLVVSGAVLVLGLAIPGTATAGSGGGGGSAVASQPAAANLCGTSTASGRAVSGALSPAQVHHNLATDAATALHARNVAGLPDKHQLSRQAHAKTGSSSPAPAARVAAQIHPSQGTSFLSQTGSDGACATQSVSTQVKVRDGNTTIYTPTLYPPGGTCIELVTVYNTSGPSVSAWDWCRSINFQASVSINSNFLATYTDGTTSAYTGRVIKTNASSNAWSAELYNYRTRTWDQLYTQSGRNGADRNDGWDIDEVYGTVGSSGRASTCDVMAGLVFESSNISVRTSGQWAAATPANANTKYDTPAGSFYCPTRTYQMISAYDHWKAVG